LAFDPLGFPLEPGLAAAPLDTGFGGTHETFRNLAVADRLSATSDTDRLREICHDMRQPVASIIALADAALSHAAVPSSVRGRLGQVRDQAEWLGDLLRHLVEPPEPRMAEDESCDLARLASDAVRFEAVTYTGELALQWSSGDMYVSGNSVELRRVIANLLSNATRAAGPAGKVVVELRRDADCALLTFDDSGPGFGHIRPGTGLGLPVVARSLNAYGGDVKYGQGPLGGVRATLALRRRPPRM
jgi:signal transduction histidine kinase